MSEEKEKQFTVKDKRSFSVSADGEVHKREPSEKEKQEPTTTEPPAKPKSEPKSEPTGHEDHHHEEIPMDFSTLLLSLSTSTLMHLGLIAEPGSKEVKKDLVAAKQSITLLEILQEKTKGNLTDEEQKFMDGVLADLRMKFVQMSQS